MNILIVCGHPNFESFNTGIAEAYALGASQHANVEILHLSKLQFDLVQTNSEAQPNEMEDDLLEAQKLISWANHIVWIYPTWWGGMPALMKGFIDRTFLSGFAFQYRKGSQMWDKLLSGKTVRVITTMDAPAWYFRLFLRKHSFQQLKKSILNFSGIKVKSLVIIGKVRFLTEEERKHSLNKITQLAQKESK